MNYYNEHDPKAAAWLRALISTGLIPNGDVDERSITEVSPRDLSAYTQCHFFAGIGGWSLALQLAGWPADRPVWTGSCPCQPFSTAGKGLAQADKRHLWPVFFELVRQCRPEFVFGEQVANAIGKGWLDGISADLESENYACGATVLGAHSVGAPHIRQRLYWVADAEEHRRGEGFQNNGRRGQRDCKERYSGAWDSLPFDGVAYSDSGRFQQRDDGIGSVPELNEDGATDRLEQPDSGRFCQRKEQHGEQEKNTTNRDSQGQHVDRPSGHLWADFTLVHCRDGKARRIPTEPAFFPLAHGIPARVVRLRGYGNAIVPQVAAEFIKAFYSLIS